MDEICADVGFHLVNSFAAIELFGANAEKN